MARIVYGSEGDQMIITEIDFGHGIEYLLECRVGAGYYTVYSSFDYNKVVSRLHACNPTF